MKRSTIYVIANFGGPRSLDEVKPFLRSLLCDQEVLRTPLPEWIHVPLFRYVAAQRAKKIRHDYEQIGNRSPIFEDTEKIASLLADKLKAPVLTFHRYLPALQRPFFKQLGKFPCGEIRVFPMFPQFSYATTGSIAKHFQRRLPKEVVLRLRWIKSYPFHPAYIGVIKAMIQEAFAKHQLQEEEVVLLFSAHGLPRSFISKGDIYQSECEASFHAVMRAFPKALGRLCFQSKFGPGEWIRPYTIDCAEQILRWAGSRKHVLFVPISFTSDHIETLFEIEKQYIPPVREAGLQAYRLPAMNVRQDWIDAIATILEDTPPVTNAMITR